ncbi:Glycoside hydrolase family 61 protein [Pleurostoma richardsiae]|uniref:lytic cellulose monooxygenase (C4-dehydrogenating) n=1 Tax=Pleurostoma richardsiae TaxID=41990 RepID=A0AA38RF77_9PEZI|nr:Glycoside hydrolase family 61 protein [Pleurostoma richardsiae]
MRFTAALSAVAFAGTAWSHATMFGVWVNDVDQGDGRNVYIRSPPNNSPVKDLTSPDLVCNVNGGTAVSDFVQAAAGDKLSFEWYHNTRGDDIIDASHKGPIITYIAAFTETDGASGIWTKIAEDGYDGSEWAVDKLIANGGKNDFTLPSGLAAGKYLIRQEIIALHEADAAFNVNSARGAQFYPSCVQVEVTGSGSAVPSQDFNFNTGYTYSDPGILFNLYTSFTSYPIPGPDVDTLEGTSGSTTGESSAAVATSAAETSAAATSEAAATSVAAVTSEAVSTTSTVARTTLATVVRSSTTEAATTTAAPTSAVSASTPCGGVRTVTVFA